MATQPTNDLLVWANTDVNLPNLAGPNKTEPSADLVAKGWDFGQKPSADEFNYILNNLSEWIEYLRTLTAEVTSLTAEGTSLNTPSTLVKRDSSGNFAATTITANLTGNADTATKWQTSRTITFNGDAVGSVVLNGASNVSCNLTVSSTSSTSVITGYVSSGGTIPLPSGYTEGQCRWIVSLRSINATNDMSDIYVSLTGRVVTVGAESGETVSNATAWYMCIGVK